MEKCFGSDGKWTAGYVGSIQFDMDRKSTFESVRKFGENSNEEVNTSVHLVGKCTFSISSNSRTVSLVFAQNPNFAWHSVKTDQQKLGSRFYNLALKDCLQTHFADHLMCWEIGVKFIYSKT